MKTWINKTTQHRIMCVWICMSTHASTCAWECLLILLGSERKWCLSWNLNELFVFWEYGPNPLKPYSESVQAAKTNIQQQLINNTYFSLLWRLTSSKHSIFGVWRGSNSVSRWYHIGKCHWVEGIRVPLRPLLGEHKSCSWQYLLTLSPWELWMGKTHK